MTGLSVVIPTYNRQEQLIQTLQRCQEVASGIDIEFIVIDDGSTDGTADTLLQLATRVSSSTLANR